MKRNFLSLNVLLLTLVLFASCLGDNNDNTTYYGDAAITSFSISSISANLTTTAKNGSDSIYPGTLAVSGYRFYIDQVNGLIYNPDSLPSNVIVTAVQPTIGTKNSGTVVYKDDDSDSIFYYNSSVGIDFTKAREMMVYAQDGSSYRKYNVKVNVHKEKADSFAWDNTYATVAKLATLENMKAVSLNGKMLVFGNNGAEAKVYAANESNFAAWEEITPNVALDVDAYKNVVVRNDVAYLLNNGNLLTSTDGENWTVKATDVVAKQLIGASSAKLYALTNEGMVSSVDGSQWTAETVGEEVVLPSKNITLLSQAARVNDNTNQLVLVGNPSENNTTDKFATVLGKVEENLESAPANNWFGYNNGKTKMLPRLTNLQVICYGDMLLAFGGDGEGACTEKAFAQFYQSVDGGVSWQKSSVIVPNFTSSKTAFTIAVDSKNYLWLICGESGQVWRGRLCKYTWAKAN